MYAVYVEIHVPFNPTSLSFNSKNGRIRNSWGCLPLRTKLRRLFIRIIAALRHTARRVWRHTDGLHKTAGGLNAFAIN